MQAVTSTSLISVLLSFAGGAVVAALVNAASARSRDRLLGRSSMVDTVQAAESDLRRTALELLKIRVGRNDPGAVASQTAAIMGAAFELSELVKRAAIVMKADKRFEVRREALLDKEADFQDSINGYRTSNDSSVREIQQAYLRLNHSISLMDVTLTEWAVRVGGRRRSLRRARLQVGEH